MKYLFMLLMGFLFLGSSTVSLAADGNNHQKSQIVNDVGFISADINAEIDFQIISKISKENLLLVASKGESLYFILSKDNYTEIYKSYTGYNCSIWQPHKGKKYIS